MQTHEPKFEEFDLESSVYRDYRERNLSLNAELTKSEEIQRNLRSSPVTIIAEIFLFLILCFAAFYTLDSINSGIAFIGSFWFAIIIIGISNRFVANILSGGKFNKLQIHIDELRNDIKTTKIDIRERVRSFEKASCDYFGTELEEFYQRNLFKKRSGNEEFDIALTEFEGMLEDVSTMNSIFLTQRVPLREYEGYLIKRKVDQSFQQAKKESGYVPTRDFTKHLTDNLVPETIVVPPPHKAYRVGRKIDNWEEIHKKNALTGLKGEEIAVALEKDFFNSINRQDLAQRVRHVASELGDGLGYDVLSFFEDGSEKYIEVKSTTAALSTPFYLSRNELSFIQEHLQNSFVYRIQVSSEIPHIEVHEGSGILENSDIIPVQYLVKSR